MGFTSSAGRGALIVMLHLGGVVGVVGTDRSGAEATPVWRELDPYFDEELAVQGWAGLVGWGELRDQAMGAEPRRTRNLLALALMGGAEA